MHGAFSAIAERLWAPARRGRVRDYRTKTTKPEENKQLWVLRPTRHKVESFRRRFSRPISWRGPGPARRARTVPMSFVIHLVVGPRPRLAVHRPGEVRDRVRRPRGGPQPAAAAAVPAAGAAVIVVLAGPAPERRTPAVRRRAHLLRKHRVLARQVGRRSVVVEFVGVAAGGTALCSVAVCRRQPVAVGRPIAHPEKHTTAAMRPLATSTVATSCCFCC